jgi:hypothetical protein
MTHDTTLDDLDDQELPGDWEAGIGERSDTHYTRFYYHPDYELSVYWDDGHDHSVVLRPDNGRDHHGYPIVSHQFDTERDAIAKAHELMRQYPE